MGRQNATQPESDLASLELILDSVLKPIAPRPEYLGLSKVNLQQVGRLPIERDTYLEYLIVFLFVIVAAVLVLLVGVWAVYLMVQKLGGVQRTHNPLAG